MELSASSRKHIFTAIEKTRSETEPHVLLEQVNPDPLQSYLNVQRIKGVIVIALIVKSYKHTLG